MTYLTYNNIIPNGATQIFSVRRALTDLLVVTFDVHVVLCGTSILVIVKMFHFDWLVTYIQFVSLLLCQPRVAVT